MQISRISLKSPGTTKLCLYFSFGMELEIQLQAAMVPLSADKTIRMLFHS